VIRLPEMIEFQAEKRVRKKLFEGAQLWENCCATKLDRPLRAILIRPKTNCS
jgi:hypothetical protein